MPPSKFGHVSCSLFPLASSCSNDYFRVYAITDSTLELGIVNSFKKNVFLLNICRI